MFLQYLYDCKTDLLLVVTFVIDKRLFLIFSVFVQEGNFHSVVHMMLQHVPPRKESVNSVDGLSRPGTTEGVTGNMEEESNNILSGGGGQFLSAAE